MEIQYYLPIASTSLAHYWGGACIKPACYFNNRPVDIQDKFNNYLFLSDEYDIKGTDCALQLVLTESERRELLDLTNGFFLLQKPLPITRIKSIVFFDRVQKDVTITNIRMSTAFVPENLIEIKERRKNKSFDQIQLGFFNQYKKDWTSRLTRFDQLLGAFALMRLAREDYMNYSENYFSTLAYFNSVIGADYEKSHHSLNSIYWDAFTGRGGYAKLFPFLNKIVEEKDVEEMAREEGQVVDKDRVTGLINLDKIQKTATYIVAVLYTYGVGNEARRKKIDGLIVNNFKLDIKPEKAEGVTLCYGLNRGYRVFSKQYDDKIVKFELNSKLDYYTIESLYQFAVSGVQKSGIFSYLDSWCPQIPAQNLPKNSKNYRILDVVVKKEKEMERSSVLSLLFSSGRIFDRLQPAFLPVIEEVVKIVADEYQQQQSDLLSKKEKEVQEYKRKIESLERQVFDYKTKYEKLQRQPRGKIYGQEQKEPVTKKPITTSIYQVASDETGFLKEPERKYSTTSSAKERQEWIDKMMFYQTMKTDELEAEAKRLGIKSNKKNKQTLIKDLLFRLAQQEGT